MAKVGSQPGLGQSTGKDPFQSRQSNQPAALRHVGKETAHDGLLIAPFSQTSVVDGDGLIAVMLAALHMGQMKGIGGSRERRAGSRIAHVFGGAVRRME